MKMTMNHGQEFNY